VRQADDVLGSVLLSLFWTLRLYPVSTFVSDLPVSQGRKDVAVLAEPRAMPQQLLVGAHQAALCSSRPTYD